VVLDWQEMMPQLVQFIILDDAGNYVFLTLILIMVVFGILNTVLMSVLERTREFGLLRALGISRHHLLWLVFCESLLLSFLAVVIGWLVGGSTHLWFSHHGIDFSALMSGGTQMMGTFMDPVVYTELSRERVVQLTTIVFAATLASGIYPAIKAARVTPVEALRT
ncbi:MAG: FtsX-like permease family protein, partial [Gammaproteobacteria bacterium]|nr:FtsX-like permease family protein [Gammaproteobacteria bacterium]MCW8958444.1 FtsX-like permease family protein [Gammaproteobacteria bacterium]